MAVSGKILLVDDNPLVLEMMSRALTREGYECLKAISAGQALEILRHNTPDIILSDYEMPETNGFEFRQQLMADTALRQIPFMFLTSKNNTQLMIEGMNMDAIDYIIKDVPVPVIISKVNNVLAAIREQHELSISELSHAASVLHLNSVPQKAPLIKGFALNFWHKPYQGYPGGDFIDFIKIDERYTIIVLGDVMGKKWGAWFFSFGFLSYIRAAARLCVFEGDLSTRSILQKINKVIYQDPVVGDVLSTLSLVMIDSQTGNISYSGAGDLPLLFFSKTKNEVTRIASGGLLLGLRAEGDFDETVWQMHPGDQLCLLTDGLTDFEEDGKKKSDYQSFQSAVTPFLGLNNAFEKFKESDFLKHKTTNQVDDCTLIFLEEQA